MTRVGTNAATVRRRRFFFCTYAVGIKKKKNSSLARVDTFRIYDGLSSLNIDATAEEVHIIIIPVPITHTLFYVRPLEFPSTYGPTMVCT